tara:strand:- start:199 stop:480 length:282 start_codon:yes stop_codon:yes gene_type:complete
MIKLIYILLFIFIANNLAYSLSNEKLYRLKYKAKNEISKLAIQNYCSKEDPGLEIDSEIADQLFYSKSCKCAIKSGKEKNYLIAKEILDLCGL